MVTNLIPNRFLSITSRFETKHLPSIGQAVMQTILSLVCSCILLYIVQKALAFWKATRAIQYALVPLPITSPNYEVK